MNIAVYLVLSFNVLIFIHLLIHRHSVIAYVGPLRTSWLIGPPQMYYFLECFYCKMVRPQWQGMKRQD